MADTVTPQGIVAVARQTPTSVRDVFAASPRLVAICEEVRDPGNLGTIIRAADAAGADAVDPHRPHRRSLQPEGRARHDRLAVPPARSRSACDLADVVDRAHAAGLRVLAADVGGDDLLRRARRCSPSRPPGCSATRPAGSTTSRLALADLSLRLPIYGSAESLNLATAASVCLYETRLRAARRRMAADDRSAPVTVR